MNIIPIQYFIIIIIIIVIIIIIIIIIIFVILYLRYMFWDSIEYLTDFNKG